MREQPNNAQHINAAELKAAEPTDNFANFPDNPTELTAESTTSNWAGLSTAVPTREHSTYAQQIKTTEL